MNGDVVEVLACPRCAGHLRHSGVLACSGCRAAYPFLGEVPCLMPEPSLWRARAAQALEEYASFTASRLGDLRREREIRELLPRTRERVARVADGLAIERALIAEVLAPLRAGALALPSPGSFSPAPLAGALELLTCYEHVFRDWAWGDAEAQDSLRIVRQLLAECGDPSVDRLAVFGAGAARLAADLHQALGNEHTLALDLGPLPLMIAQHLVRGRTLTAVEFPVAPLGAEGVAIARELRCPYPVRPGLTLLLADALQPPFGDGALSAVLTPWFIDEAGADPRVSAAVIWRVLEPGGLWLNFGPLRFTGSTARVYSIEEVLDIVGDSGFEVCAQIRERVPYFASPDSGFHRREVVYGFAARKRARSSADSANRDPIEAAALAVPRTEPAWLLDPHVPVPALAEWTAIRESAGLAEQVLSLLDGQRSVADLALILGQRWGAEPATLHAELQSYLVRFLPR